MVCSSHTDPTTPASGTLNSAIHTVNIYYAVNAHRKCRSYSWYASITAHNDRVSVSRRGHAGLALPYLTSCRDIFCYDKNDSNHPACQVPVSYGQLVSTFGGATDWWPCESEGAMDSSERYCCDDGQCQSMQAGELRRV